MAKEGRTFEQWLRDAGIRREELTDRQRPVLYAVFCFLQPGSGDYAISRIAGYFLLHCNVGLKMAQIARLVGISERSASRHRKLSARQVVQQIQHRFSGRPYGKLLPRHAGSIAEFLFTHAGVTREELLDFIERTWQFRVSKVALWEFLKKYGLDSPTLDEVRQTASREEEEGVIAQVLDSPAAGGLVPVVPARFFLPIPSMPGLSCCGPKCNLGLPRRASASPTTTARSNGVF